MWLSKQAKRQVAENRSHAQIAQQWREADVPQLLGCAWDSGAVQRAIIMGETIANEGQITGTFSLGG